MKAMEIFISPGHIVGDVRTMTVTLRGNDGDFINMIDEGSGSTGDVGILAAKMASATGLVDSNVDVSASAARLLRRAAELLDPPN